MGTFVLLWNPTKKWAWPEKHLRSAIAATKSGKQFKDQWSMGNRRSGVDAGDRCVLLRTAVDRGIVASGRFVDGLIWEDGAWEGSESPSAHYARLKWDWVDPTNPIGIETLNLRVPQVNWDRLQASGTKCPPDAEKAIEDLLLGSV